jgi:hypothetical protein
MHRVMLSFVVVLCSFLIPICFVSCSLKLCIFGWWRMCLLCRLVLVTFLFVLLFLVGRFLLYTSCVLRGALRFQWDWFITYKKKCFVSSFFSSLIELLYFCISSKENSNGENPGQFSHFKFESRLILVILIYKFKSGDRTAKLTFPTCSILPVVRMLLWQIIWSSLVTLISWISLPRSSICYTLVLKIEMGWWRQVLLSTFQKRVVRCEIILQCPCFPW